MIVQINFNITASLNADYWVVIPTESLHEAVKTANDIIEGYALGSGFAASVQQVVRTKPRRQVLWSLDNLRMKFRELRRAPQAEENAL
jgi:hypothetical protein